MVKTIMLSSTKGGSGKSIIAVGSFVKLKDDMGKKPGYFKPIGDKMSMTTVTRTDKDVNVITVIVARQFAKEDLCPQFFSPGYFLDEIADVKNIEVESKQILDKIMASYNHIASSGVDIMLIEGNHSFRQYRAIDLDDARIAKEIGAEIILCCPVHDDDDINELVAAYDWYKCQEIPVIGVILNGLSEMMLERIESFHKPLLEKRGIKILGGLQKSHQLEKPTVAEVIDAISGKLLVGRFIEVKNNLVDGFIIGAMSAESATQYIKRGRDKCLITGGDRSDIILAALETSTSMIVLTGNIEPAPMIMSAAEEKGIPIVLTPHDTFTVSEKVKQIHTHLQANEIQLCKDQVDKFIDFSFI